MSLDLIAVVLGTWAFICCFDRLRQISWKSVQSHIVFLYLAATGFSLGMAWDGVRNEVHIWMFGVIFCILGWLITNRHSWKVGVPRTILHEASK